MVDNLRMYGRYLEDIWGASWGYLGNIWRISGGYLWNIFGKSWEYYGDVFENILGISRATERATKERDTRK